MPADRLQHVRAALAITRQPLRHGWAVEDVHRTIAVACERPKLLLRCVEQRIVQDSDVMPCRALAGRQREGLRPLIEQRRDARDVCSALLGDQRPRRQRDVGRGDVGPTLAAHVPSPRIMLSMSRVLPTRAATIATLSADAVSTAFMSIGSTIAK